MIKIRRRESVFATLMRAVFLLAVAIPVLWGLGISFRSNQEIAEMKGVSIHSFIPLNFTIENYLNFFNQVDFLRSLGITLFVCLSVTIVTLLLTSMAGYAFARMKFPGKKILFAIILSTMLLPIELLIIPLYGQIRSFGMIDSLSSLILPFIASGFGIFFMRQFIAGIPTELEEAAIIDGCSRWGFFFRVLLPLCKTPLITLGTIIFLAQWDSLLVPVTFINDSAKMVLQVILAELYSGVYFNDQGILFAGIVITSIPIIIIFAFTQRYYLEGITSTGIKG